MGSIKEMLEKAKNVLMPVEEEEEFISEKAEVEEEVVQETRRVANGAPVFASAVAERPRFKARAAKASELSVDIYVPSNFDQVTGIADDLLAKKAAIVNFERVDLAEQRRICDFVNGVCYVLDGEARRISDGMMLYVPASVDVATAKARPVKK